MAKKLQEHSINSDIKESEQIDGFLLGMSRHDDARGIILPNVKFYDAESKEYKSAVGHPEVINDKSIRQVSIDLNGQTRYFQQIAYLNGALKTDDPEHGTDNTGLKATAWQETNAVGEPIKVNGKQEIRLNFPGITGNGKKWTPADHIDALDLPVGSPLFVNRGDFQSLNDFMDGKLNRQAGEAAAFTKRVIDQLGAGNISNIIYGAHSVGSGNALAAHLVSDLEGVPTKSTLLIEPVGANMQLDKMREAMSDPNSKFFGKLQELGYSEEQIKGSVALFDKRDHITSIRAIEQDKGGSFHGSEMARVKPGYGQILGWAHWISSKILGTNNPAQGDSNANNDMIGNKVLQTIDDSCRVKTSSALGKMDPNHALGTAVNCAREIGVYYKVADVPEYTDKQPPPIQQSGVVSNTRSK